MNLRTRLWLRCDGHCEKCGIQLGYDWAMHHRKLKSRGGKDEITNVVALHHHCHNLGSDSVHLNVREATERGYIVNSWDEPGRVPLLMADDTLVLLTELDGYEIVGRADHGWSGDSRRAGWA
jgi:hypothetical protein